jgi:hypothetical protein
MLQVFYLDVVYVLQWFSSVSCIFFVSVLDACFKNFNCFKRMLQVLYLDVAYIAAPIHICRR